MRNNYKPVVILFCPAIINYAGYTQIFSNFYFFRTTVNLKQSRRTVGCIIMSCTVPLQVPNKNRYSIIGILIIKPTRYINFSNYFWNRTVHVSDSFSVQRNYAKHVELYSKNKFEKLIYLIGFIIRIYHDARSSECQN